MGPLPSSQGFYYLLTMIDRMTRWPEVALLASISAESCVHGSQGSVFQLSSPLTGELSLPPPSGPGSVLLLGSQPLGRPLLILKATE